MKVGEVTRLLEGIALGLRDLSGKTADGLIEFQVAMQPFAQQTVDQFVMFLRQCLEYKETGIVTVTDKKTKGPPKPKAPALTVADASARVRTMLGEISNGSVTGASIENMLNEFEKGLTKPKWDELLKNLEIAGKAASKPKAVAMLRQVLTSQLEMHVKSQAH